MPLRRRDAVFSGSARREASRVSSEGVSGVPRTGAGAREAGIAPVFYILGLPSHAALSETGEWSGVAPEPPEDWSWTKKTVVLRQKATSLMNVQSEGTD